MPTTVPRSARVVVVGGGVAGCSTAYHLAKRGWSDVVLVERHRLTSGTTWHAAGLITTARPTSGTREIVKRSLEVFRSLEAETGYSPGFERTGTLHLADSAARWEELRRQASAAHGNGITAELISPDDAVRLFPPLYAGDLAGAVYYPDDGRGNATDTTMALAGGARQLGVQILENTTVTNVHRRGDHVTGVSTTAGEIEAGYVVNATGMWGREFGALAGAAVPLQALAHYYIVTEPIPGLPPGLPTIKTPGEYAYVKNEGR
jgi:4-methylaminobutanoate oxidase (formaldehyde-forming)